MFAVLWRIMVTMVMASMAVNPVQLCQCFPNCCGKYCGKVLVCLMMLLLTVCSASNPKHNRKDRRTCTNGTISPKQPYFLEGEDIFLICNRNKGSSRNLTFVRGRTSEEVPSKYIQQYNATAIKMVIPNITAEDIDASTPFTQYRCVHKKKRHKNNRRRCYDNVYVRLEHSLRKPVDLNCWDYNFNEMRCNWSLAVEYHNSGDINVTCEYQNTSDEETSVQFASDGFWEPCPNLVNTSCLWKPASYSAPVSDIRVRVRVTNTKRNISEVINKTFNKLDIVEPGPVSNLKIDHKLSQNRCVELQWKPATPTESYVFNVTYSSPCFQEVEKKVYYYKKKFNYSVTICNQVPYANSTFSVKGRVITEAENGTYIERGYWSQPEELTEFSNKDVLDVNPVTYPGLYERFADFLRLYWTPLKDCDLHDTPDEVSYSLSLNNVTKSLKHPAFMAEIDSHIPHTSILNVTLQASNSIGSPPTYRYVSIFPAEFGPEPSDLIIQVNKTNEDCVTNAEIVVKEKPFKFSNLFHTLVWCKGTQSCEEPVELKKLKNVTSFEFPGNLCDADYRYGLVTHGYSNGGNEIYDTGIQWEHCIYQTGKEIDRPLVVYGLQQVEEGTFKVWWKHYDCKEMKAFVTHYSVEYCASDDICSCKHKNTVNVSRDDKNYTLTIDESAGSHICVWVRGVSTTGKGPINEKPEMITIDKEDYSIVIIVVSVVSFAVFILIVLFCIRRGYKKLKKMKEENRQITIPSVRLEIGDYHGNTQDQHDRLLNGIDPGSSSVLNYHTSAGTTYTCVPNSSEGQPLIDYDCESSGDIAGYKSPNNLEAIESGYQEEAFNSNYSLEEGSEDQERLEEGSENEVVKSQKTFGEQKNESLVIDNMDDSFNVAITDAPDQIKNIDNSLLKAHLDQVNDSNHKENFELQPIKSACANHSSSSSILEEETELTLEEYIDKNEKPDVIYTGVDSGSTISDVSDEECQVEELNENDDKLFQQTADGVSMDKSDESKDISDSISSASQTSTSAITNNSAVSNELFEQKHSGETVTDSTTGLSEEDDAGGYKRAEDVQDMSESDDESEEESNYESGDKKYKIVNGLIGKNGFISSVPNSVNSNSSGSESSIEHQLTSSGHGNSGSSSGVKSYVKVDIKHNLQEEESKYDQNTDDSKLDKKSKKIPYQNGMKIPATATS